MRLIDADLLKKNCKCTGTFESNFQCVSLKTLGDLIDAQPTAYEVDKVLEQLEDATAIGADCVGNAFECISKHMAIEIVKHGGVSDDVCEWKRDDMCDTVYKVCGGCFTSEYQKDFKYCPYCGKKIKVVE